MASQTTSQVPTCVSCFTGRKKLQGLGLDCLVWAQLSRQSKLGTLSETHFPCLLNGKGNCIVLGLS